MSDWLIFLLGALAGAVAVKALPLAFYSVVWLFIRNVGIGDCYVCAHKRGWDIGERTNLYRLLNELRHDLFWASRGWHKRAWAAHRWNRSAPEGTRWDVRIECSVCEPGNGFVGDFQQRGPYSSVEAAEPVARDHERTVHRGEHVTSVIESSRP